MSKINGEVTNIAVSAEEFEKRLTLKVVKKIRKQSEKNKTFIDTSQLLALAFGQIRLKRKKKKQ